MTRSVLDLEDELGKIYGLVGELSEQLAANRTLVTQLKGRSENVKGQATHVGTGFPLRRFNLDISDEEFNSELEKFASHLILENQSLQHENKQLGGLLKEYETTLENVMSKFRGVAHASQQHDLSLHSYYTSLLSTIQTAHSSSQLHDDTTLSLLLSRLSTLLRSTLRSLGGEEVDGELQQELTDLVNGLEEHPQIKAEQDEQRQQQAEAGPGPSTAATFASISGRSTMSKPPRKPNPFPGSLPGSSGGYIGTEGQSDWAIEREMEIFRLEQENASLRELLSIAKEIPVDEEPLVIPPMYSPEPIPLESRKGSLTIEELEEDATREAEEKRRAEMLAERLGKAEEDQVAAGAGQVEMMTDAPGEVGAGGQDTGVVDAGDQGSGKRPRPSLIFQSGTPPEQAIADETEPDTADAQ